MFIYREHTFERDIFEADIEDARKKG